eukprot:6573403-Heterocapsa_arctica.AAC.1
MTSWPYEDLEDPWSQQQQDQIISIIATRIPISTGYESINWLILKGSKLAIVFLAVHENAWSHESSRGDELNPVMGSNNKLDSGGYAA